MTRALLCLFCLTFAAAAQAQEIPVRGGDHDGFTRLVLNLRQPQDWTMTKTETGYRVALPDWQGGFNLSQVFFKITRDRVSAVAATQDAVSFDLACDCKATATQLTSGVIFVDIEPGETAQSPAPEPTLETPPQTAPITLPEFTARAPRFQLVEPAAEAPPAPQLEGLREKLFQGLERSAGLSLIELNTGPPDQIAPAQTPSPDIQQRIKISNAFERSTVLPIGETDVAQPLATCPAPQTFDISLWGEPDTFADQLAMLRRQIPAEFDRFDPDDVLNLAQLYLYFGLGAEARMVLRTFDIAAGDSNRITALAQIIEPNSAVETPAVFEGVNHCAGVLTPWLLLSAPRTATLNDAVLRDLTTTFSTWPPHLRAMLGPQLIATLTTRGFEAPASVIRSMTMMSQEGDPEMPAVQGKFDDLPLAELQEVVDSGGDDTPAALSSYLTQIARNALPLDPIYIELAEAYERETKGLPVSDALNTARIIALGHLGRFTEAKALLQEHIDQDAPVAGTVLQTLVTQVMSRDDPLEIASIAMFTARIERLSDLPDNVLLTLSKQMLDAGLPELSAKVIKAHESPPAELTAQITAAQLSSEMAIEALQSIPDPQAEKLRVKLMMNAGRADQVWAEEQTRLQPDQVPDVAWAAKAWAQVEGDTARGEIADLLDAGTAASDPDKPIAQATAMGATSAKARALISEMLAPPPS